MPEPEPILGRTWPNPASSALPWFQDRAKAEQEAKALTNLKLGDEGTRGFTYVCIPADEDAPVTGRLLVIIP